MCDADGSETRGVYARVFGRVQGVGFRVSTLDRAMLLGLVGYVQNLWDGSVEVVAEGPRSALGDLVTWLHQGPPMARVDRVSWQWRQPKGEFRSELAARHL